MNELIRTISGISSEIEDEFFTMFCMFLRVGGAMAFLPGLGEHVIPVRIRLIITLCLTALLIEDGTEKNDHNGSDLYYIKDVAVGLAIGFSFRILIFSVEIFGHIVSNMISMAQVFPTGAEVSPVIATMMKYSATLLLVNLGLFELYYDALSIKLDNLATLDISSAAYWFTLLLPRMTDCLNIALSLSVPFIIFSMLYNIVLGIMNRIMPALMVHLIFAPAMSLFGLALFAIISSYSLMQWLKMIF